MVLIKLDYRHKTAALAGSAILAAVLLLSIVRVVSGNIDNAKNADAINTEVSTTQYYTTTTGNSTTVSTTNSTAEDENMQTEITDVTTTVIATTTTTNNTHNEEYSVGWYYTDQDAIDIAKVLYFECGAVPSKTEQACVAWAILNRIDRDGSTIYSVVRTPYQYAFDEDAPVWDNLLELAYDVLDRWSREKNGESDVGRVLPKEYLYFNGDGKHNYFRNNYLSPYDLWDYSLESPYED